MAARINREAKALAGVQAQRTVPTIKVAVKVAVVGIDSHIGESAKDEFGQGTGWKAIGIAIAGLLVSLFNRLLGAGYPDLCGFSWSGLSSECGTGNDDVPTRRDYLLDSRDPLSPGAGLEADLGLRLWSVHRRCPQRQPSLEALR